MDWGELLGQTLIGAVGFVQMQKWMEIENPTTLRFTIRGDIRDLSPDTTRSWLRALDTAIQNFAMMDNHALRDQGTMVREIMIEEAERRDNL